MKCKDIRIRKSEFVTKTQFLSYQEEGTNTGMRLRTKVIMQGKLIAVEYTLGSLWAEFVNKNRCISVHLVSDEVKSIKF